MQTYLLLIATLGVFSLMGCRPPLSEDATTPTVVSTTPVDGTTGVALNGTISVTFSEAMDPATTTTTNFTVVQGSTPVTGTVTYDASSNTASFAPAGILSVGAAYTATVTTGVKDVSGNALAANTAWSFTAGVAVDTTAPAIVSTVPVNLATNVAVNDAVAANFSEGMDGSTISTTTFTLAAGGTAVTGTVTYDVPNKSAIFAPASNLSTGTVYTATVKTGARDLAGNALASNTVWTFTTTTTAGLGPAPVNLKTAGSFAILAKAAITDVPASTVTGDIGLSPAAESYVTGFSQTDKTGYATSPQVTGFIYAASMAPPTPVKMTTAISDMQTAYTDAAGRTTPDFLDLGAGTLSGNTLVPGLYKWGTGLNLTGGVVISGAANDTWIFQISGNLIVSNTVRITLTGGAQAKNIFWQLSGEATLGTTSHFEGTILSQTAITLQTGATMNGRALAQTLVALQQATITKP
jgi:hypothetical protein